jgi:predicted SAM-dependent methyltransferase
MPKQSEIPPKKSINNLEKNDKVCVLNIGCGYSFEGTDRIDLVKTPATTKVCNIEDGLPYKENTFDKIICHHVFEHIRNLKSFLEECYRVLKIGGKIDLRTDNAGFLIFHIKNDHNTYVDNWEKTLRPNEHVEDHHYHLFVPSHLNYLFKLAGFKGIKIRYAQMYENVFKRIFLNLLPFNMGKVELRVEAYKTHK